MHFKNLTKTILKLTNYTLTKDKFLPRLRVLNIIVFLIKLIGIFVTTFVSETTHASPNTPNSIINFKAKIELKIAYDNILKIKEKKKKNGLQNKYDTVFVEFFYINNNLINRSLFCKTCRIDICMSRNQHKHSFI
ncbi:hypothetical protein CDIK_2492 [Cucumispora dikerogammari]|nr:hypothetical protein CDIK_2492 [Cucumispora dikerogammari]